MKTNFKIPVFTLIACMLLALSAGILSCEKTVDDLQLSYYPAEDGSGGPAQNDDDIGGPHDMPFSYKLKPSYCSRYGTNVAVLIENEEMYKVRWEVDGLENGTGMLLPCITGKEVTAHVTRISDRVTVIKSIRLTPRQSPEVTGNSQAFDFNIKMVKCGNSGYSLSVLVNNKSQYDFTWIIDGEHALGQTYVDCTCAKTVSLTVKRKSDGVTQSKTITLPACKAIE
jgi:hypothetical protein